MSLSFALLALCVATASAEDPNDLEDTFEAVLEDLNTKDLEGFLSAWHPQAVLVTRNYLFAVDRKDAGQEIWDEIFADFFSKTTKVSYTAVDVEYRVVGDVGMAWGLTQSIFEAPDRPRVSQNSRLTAVFVKSDGNWKIISWHESAYPETGR